MVALLARLLRLASVVISLIALASFAAFALDQTSGASNHQQAEVNAAEPSDQTTTAKSSEGTHKSTFHEAVDEVSSTLASPFSGVTSGSHSQWTIHILDTLFILLLYGFGLGFLARLVRVNL